MKTKNNSVTDVYKTFICAIPAILIFFAPLNMQAFSGGDGSPGNPYIIKTAAELAELGSYVNNGDADYNAKSYRLGNDISLSGYQAGEGWKPIGSNMDNSFQGTFDGYDYKITGLKISATSGVDIGLFGYVVNGTIRNLGVENANIVRESGPYFANAGGVAGSTYHSTIYNCYSTGTVGVNAIAGSTGVPHSYAGGIAGYVDYNSTIELCYSTAAVSAIAVTYSYAGGIAGYLDKNSSLLQCYATGAINSTNCAGGVVGYIDVSYVSHCYATGAVSADHNSTAIACAGGVAGYLLGGSVEYCYSTGAVSSSHYAGGIVGYLRFHTIANCVALNPSISRIPHTPAITHYGERVLGFTPSEDVLLENNFGLKDMINPDGTTEWTRIGADKWDGANITKEQVNYDGTINGCFAFPDIWATESGKLPGLFGAPVDMPEHLHSDENYVWGCIDPNALNYDPEATLQSEDFPCEYEPSEIIFGCMDPDAGNYNQGANSWSLDYPCVYDEEIIWGCTDSYADNHDIDATANDGSCHYSYMDEMEDFFGCTDPKAVNYISFATIDEGCVYEDDDECPGCNDFKALTYNPKVTLYKAGSCIYAKPGFTFHAFVPKEPDAVVGTFTQENCDLVSALNDMFGVHIYSVTIIKVEPAADGNTLVSWEIKLENGTKLGTEAVYPIPYSMLEGQNVLFYLSFICDLPNQFRAADFKWTGYTLSAFFSVLPTGISHPEQGAKNWRVYPNPTDGELNMDNGGLKITNVEIYDVYGRKLSTFNFQLSTQQLDISRLPAGIYVLRATTADGKVESARVVKK